MMQGNSCGVFIKQIHDTLEKQANNALRKDDLTMAQIGVLLALNESGDKGKSLKELEQILHVAQSTAAGIVVRLEQKGFVEGFGDPYDKRVKLVRVTPSGRACCDKAHKNMTGAEDYILSGLTDTEKVIFQTLLKKVCSSLS